MIWYACRIGYFFNAYTSFSDYLFQNLMHHPDLFMIHRVRIKIVQYLGKKLNALSYSKVAKFSKKYHNISKNDYSGLTDKKFVDLILKLVENLYLGNASYSPDTVEYKITMGTMKKIEKLAKVLHIDLKKLLKGYTLTETIEPLLYNSGIDDDNAVLDVK